MSRNITVGTTEPASPLPTELVAVRSAHVTTPSGSGSSEGCPSSKIKAQIRANRSSVGSSNHSPRSPNGAISSRSLATAKSAASTFRAMAIAAQTQSTLPTVASPGAFSRWPHHSRSGHGPSKTRITSGWARLSHAHWTLDIAVLSPWYPSERTRINRHPDRWREEHPHDQVMANSWSNFEYRYAMSAGHERLRLARRPYSLGISASTLSLTCPIRSAPAPVFSSTQARTALSMASNSPLLTARPMGTKGRTRSTTPWTSGSSFFRPIACSDSRLQNR